MEWKYEKQIWVDLHTSAQGTFLGVPLTIQLTPRPGAAGPAKISGGFQWECRRKSTGTNVCEAELRSPRKVGPTIITAFDPEPYQSANIGAQGLAALAQLLPGFAPTAEVRPPSIRLSPEVDVINDGTKCVRVFAKTRLEYDPGKVVVKVSIPVPGFGRLPFTSEFNIGTIIDSTWEAVYSICCCECLNEVPYYDERRDGEYQNYIGEVFSGGQEQCNLDYAVSWIGSQGGRDPAARWAITAEEGPCCKNVQVAVEEDGTRLRVIPGQKLGSSHTPYTQ